MTTDYSIDKLTNDNRFRLLKEEVGELTISLGMFDTKSQAELFIMCDRRTNEDNLSVKQSEAMVDSIRTEVDRIIKELRDNPKLLDYVDANASAATLLAHLPRAERDTKHGIIAGLIHTRRTLVVAIPNLIDILPTNILVRNKIHNVDTVTTIMMASLDGTSTSAIATGLMCESTVEATPNIITYIDSLLAVYTNTARSMGLPDNHDKKLLSVHIDSDTDLLIILFE